MAENHNVNAEQSVLGVLLHRADAIDDIGDLKPSDFWVMDNQIIFETISLMTHSGEPVDVVTVDEKLTATGRAANISGVFSYLADLAQNVPSTANINRYAKIVHDHAMTRALIEAGAQIQKIADENGPIDEKIAKSQEITSRLDQNTSTSTTKTIQETILGCLKGIDARLNGRAVKGVKTGLHALDDLTGGFNPGDLVILAGRPSSGKTALSLNMAGNMAKTGMVLFVSLEMPADQLGQRMIANYGDIDLNRIRYGTEYSEDEYSRISTATSFSNQLNMSIDEFSNTIPQIAASARRIKRNSGLVAIFVDYIGFIDGDGENQNIKVSRISAGLKRIAKQLEVPVIALSQLNREVDKRADKRPMMSDLRDSGSLEQDADVIIMAYRDEYYYKNSTGNKQWVEIIIAKQRQGETATVLAKFEGSKMFFKNIPVEQWHQYQPAKNAGNDKFAGGFD